MKSLAEILGICLAALSLPCWGLTPADYSRTMEITASGYSDSVELSDFPALVRLSPAIGGFSYADFSLPNGGDLRFTDAEGNLLASEVDTWDESGESLVWVKVPTLAANTKIIAYYGNPTPDAMASVDLWDGYLGVWHFNEIAEGVTADSTANGLDMRANSPSFSVAEANGQFGGSLVNAKDPNCKTGGFKTADYRGLFEADAFTVSAWFNRNGAAMNGYERFFSSKVSWDDPNGFEMENANGDKTKCTVRGSTSRSFNVEFPDLTVSRWIKVTLVYNGTELSVYANGELCKSGTVEAVKPNANGFAVGNNARPNEQSLRGNVDEVRFVKSCLSAERIRAEYAAESAADFFSYSEVSTPDESAIVFAAAPTVAPEEGAFVLSATLAKGAGALYAVYGVPGFPMTTNLIENAATAPNTYTYRFPELAADTSYAFEVIARNEKGTWTKKAGETHVLNGRVVLAKGADAAELNLSSPGTVLVSRPSGTGAVGDLVVNYTVGGTAVAGAHYKALPGSLTIPDGVASAAIEIWPIRAKDGDHTVTISLAEGAYLADDEANAATVLIKQLTVPEGYNTWIAAADGKASDPANWSGGVPAAADRIYIDALFSNANMEWDLGVNGLSAEVAEWTQMANYAGTVTFATGYAGETALLTIAGNAVVEGGSWSHPSNTAAQVSRLNVAVGGDFTLGTAAKIDAVGRGFAAGKFPAGSGIGCHACSPQGDVAKVYGDLCAPIDLGSGGTTWDNADSAGGGAVCLAIAGKAVIDGRIGAGSSSQKSAKNNFKANEKGVGAGGSVFITAKDIAGSGFVDASARREDSQAEGASGGRIALVATEGDVALPYANLTANGESGSKTSGGGTIFIKKASSPNGELLVGTTRGEAWSFVGRYPAPMATTIVPPGQTWTFDRVLLRGQGILGVPLGATLVLPNGFASVSEAPANITANQCGILYFGGTIQVPAGEHLISGGWLFEAIEPYTFDGNLRLTDRAGVGNLVLLQTTATNSYQNQVVVNGDLTVDSTGLLYAKMRGQRNITNGETGAAHGGIASGTAKAPQAYDSIFHPRFAGLCGQKGDPASENIGGGAIKLVVSGMLTLNGKADLSGVFTQWNAHGAAGGSLDITAGSLSGSGSISVDGCYAANEKMMAGPGGRVAVKLTDPAAVFSDYWKSAISAKGADSKTPGMGASAGTIYLQDGSQSDGAGAIIVRNTGSTAITAPTPIPSATWGNETATELKGASLSVEKAAIVRIEENLRLREATVAADSNGKIDLNGKTLTVSSLTLGGVKVASGSYKIGDAALGEFVQDSSESGDGALIVSSGGFRIIIR